MVMQQGEGLCCFRFYFAESRDVESDRPDGSHWEVGVKTLNHENIQLITAEMT